MMEAICKLSPAECSSANSMVQPAYQSHPEPFNAIQCHGQLPIRCPRQWLAACWLSGNRHRRTNPRPQPWMRTPVTLVSSTLPLARGSLPPASQRPSSAARSKSSGSLCIRPLLSIPASPSVSWRQRASAHIPFFCSIRECVCVC